ncbi:MAG: hypothetical protein ACD_45C00027G0001, partial [uncultured bacterium]
NILSHKALMSAYGLGKFHVTFFDVMRACKDTESISNYNTLAVVLGLSLAVMSMFFLLYWRI